ncbi:hypothetical protein [Bythopirellula polymerisocia]|uniref:Uncharacterized protein n=1 Tax=Bythopirellula polymerisocia TaxID=2528003 RepID=A0A5C6D242_9BACT|nr:hypothetical protein [Bythopirellula polymerisocia]TWU30195.1 hypothetical protein Pla144_09810 [Bythopirellula polymerisocia]
MFSLTNNLARLIFLLFATFILFVTPSMAKEFIPETKTVENDFSKTQLLMEVLHTPWLNFVGFKLGTENALEYSPGFLTQTERRNSTTDFLCLECTHSEADNVFTSLNDQSQLIINFAVPVRPATPILDDISSPATNRIGMGGGW